MSASMTNQLVETYNATNRVNLYLLNEIEEEWLSAKLAGKGRTIGEQFVHINNIRSMWINKGGNKVNIKVDKKIANNKKALKEALSISGKAMSDYLEKVLIENKIKGYKPHPIAFFAQMIAHEAHHRGQISVTITRNDFKISKSVNFGLWGWNTK